MSKKDEEEVKRLKIQIGSGSDNESVDRESESENLSVVSLSGNSFKSGSSVPPWNNDYDDDDDDDDDDKNDLGSQKFKIKAVVIIEPLLVIGLFTFYINLYATGGTFNTESDYPESDTEHRLMERIRDNHRITSYKRKRRTELFFFVFTVFTASLIFLSDVLVAFNSKNKMAACLLWIWAHIWWSLICMAQAIRAFVDYSNLQRISSDVKNEDVWKMANFEVSFVLIFFTAFFVYDIISIIIVKNRFRYLRKEAKTAQHSAGKRLIQTLKKRKNARLKQKESYYEREGQKRASRRPTVSDADVGENPTQTKST